MTLEDLARKDRLRRAHLDRVCARARAAADRGRSVLDALPGPVVDLAARTGYRPDSVRRALRRHMALGAVEFSTENKPGRGRNRRIYRTVQADE